MPETASRVGAETVGSRKCLSASSNRSQSVLPSHLAAAGWRGRFIETLRPQKCGDRGRQLNNPPGHPERESGEHGMHRSTGGPDPTLSPSLTDSDDCYHKTKLIDVEIIHCSDGALRRVTSLVADGVLALQCSQNVLGSNAPRTEGSGCVHSHSR